MEGAIVENAVMLAVAIVAALIGVFKYIKTDSEKDKSASKSDTGTVVAASFLDSRLIRELVDGLNAFTEEFSREGRKMNRTRQELTTALEESTDAVLTNTDTMVNMVRFLRRQDTRSGSNEELERINLKDRN